MSPLYQGQFGQAGTYQNPQGTYGLPNAGIVLSSGNVSAYATGSNGTDGLTTCCGEGDEGQQDFAATPEQEALLNGITGQDQHFDVSQLTIDFFAPANVDEVTFFGVFGSEEFPDFVGSSFSDGFGLFVNGDNVAGAVVTPFDLPDGVDPEDFNVDGRAPGDNAPININHPNMLPIAGTELDGVLAPAGPGGAPNPVLRFDVPVNPGNVNTFDIIVADASDSSLDTTVYLSSFFSEDSPPAIGETEFNPVLPVSQDPNTGTFVIPLPDDLEDGETVWIDPPVSVGFEYEVDGGAKFASVLAPSNATVADSDGYFITVGDTTVALGVGGSLDFMATFGFLPDSFILTGIDLELMLDPDDPMAFPLGVSLDGIVGTTIVNMTPITEDVDTMAPVPLPASALLYFGALGFGGVLLRRRRRKTA